MKTINVLDVTLRDGGCVNDFNFGETCMNIILQNLQCSGVEYIEMGYMDTLKGSNNGRTKFKDELKISDFLHNKKRSSVRYLAMTDYGRFDYTHLSPRTPDGIDGIRLAFHKEDASHVIEIGKMILQKGYELFLQPMLTTRYTGIELSALLDRVNDELPKTTAFYIVDSFGEMLNSDVQRIMNLVDQKLSPEIICGFHSHNNLQMSFANAIEFLQLSTNRSLMLDCSISGMGKGAGNLSTELLLDYLNKHYRKQYRIEPLFDCIDTVMKELSRKYSWGYSIEYYLSAINRCSPSYASFFYKKGALSVEKVSKILLSLDERKKISFDAEYAEQMLKKYHC